MYKVMHMAFFRLLRPLAFIFVIFLATGIAFGEGMGDFMDEGKKALDESRYADAVEAFSKVVEVAPDSPFGYVGRGRAFERLGKLDVALENFHKAVEIDPEFHLALLGRAGVFMRLLRYDEAAEDFNRLLELDPSNQTAQRGLVKARRRAGKSPLAGNNGGTAQASSGQQGAQGVSPQGPGAYRPQGQRTPPQGPGAYRPQGQGIPPRGPGAYRPQGQGTPPRGPGAYRPQGQGTSPQGQGVYQVGGNRSDDNRGPGYIKIIASGTSQADESYKTGNNFMRLGRYGDAVKSYEEAVGHDPKHSKAYLNMGIALKRMERYSDSVTAYTRALNVDPNYDKAYFNRGVAYKLLGQTTEAIEDFRSTLKVNPEFKQATQQLAALGVTTGDAGADPRKAAPEPPKKASVDILKDIPVAAAPNPDAIAVVIGNRDYLKAKPVEFALNDAWAVKQYLMDALGYKEGNVFFVQNATQTDFALYFGNRGNYKGKLFNAVKEGKSDVFVYYSGHGAPGLKDKKGYFVPVEADPNYLELGGYQAEVFYENLSKIPARSITVVLEACFSGANIFENISPMVVEVENPVSNFSNGVVLSSSSGSQVSSWYNDKGYGLFTYFFLKGMQKANADFNHDGTISYEEIYSYVSDKTEGVPYYARRIHGVEQDPTLEGEYKGKALLRY